VNKLIAWIELKRLAFQDWLDSWQPCPKEQAGYNCHHRTMSNGKKECGYE